MKLMRWALCVALLGCAPAAEAGLEFGGSEPASCGPAVALVFGQEFGPQSPLLGVAKDARDMKRALDAIGVETKLLLNQDVTTARSALKAFASDKLGALHILYFAGAGGQEAKAPSRLWFLASAVKTIPENVAEASLAFDEIAADLGQGGQPSLIIIDSSLGDVRAKTEKQIILLAGDYGQGTNNGGVLTQAIVRRLFESAAGNNTDLLNVFRSSAAASRAVSSGATDPILLLRGSSPEISVQQGMLACTLPASEMSR